MLFLVAALVFIVVTLAVFVAMSLFDERKAQARLLRDRLSGSSVQTSIAQAKPDVALPPERDGAPRSAHQECDQDHP